jgi:hypothetical protein
LAGSKVVVSCEEAGTHPIGVTLVQDPRKPGPDAPPDSDAVRRHEDERIDEALDGSFPASDPPSMTDPLGHATTWGKKA